MRKKNKPMKQLNKRSVYKNEKGMVLIISIALLAIIALLGTIAVKTTTIDLKISSNSKKSKEAFFIAESGLEEARARMRGTSTAANYIGDTDNPPDVAWSAYIRSSSSWNPAVDDPAYDASYTNDVYESLQSDLPYWVKIRHKREADILSVETYTDDSLAANPIIYYGYGTVSASTIEQFTTDNPNPYIMAPVEIISVYGTSSSSSNSLEIQVRKGINPPISGALYGDAVDLRGSVSITGDDNCSGNSVPAVAYSSSIATSGGAITLTSDAGTSSALASPLDIESLVDELQTLATDIITDDDAGYSIGSDSDYRIIYCDTSQLDAPNPDSQLDLNTAGLGGYGTLVVRGNLDLGGSIIWHGLIICTGTIDLHGGGTGKIYGAIIGQAAADANGTPDIFYDSCEIANAMGSYTYSVSSWKDDALD